MPLLWMVTVRLGGVLGGSVLSLHTDTGQTELCASRTYHLVLCTLYITEISSTPTSAALAYQLSADILPALCIASTCKLLPSPYIIAE